MAEDRDTIIRLIKASMRAAEELEHQAEAQRRAVQRMIDAIKSEARP